jgi:hypothetical protein
VDIFKHCQKNKKIKRADQILPEVYGTTLMRFRLDKFHGTSCILNIHL